MFKNEFLPKLLRETLKATPFEKLYRLLPFASRIVSGFTYNHIQYLGAFDIETPGRYGTFTVSEGDTLCRRDGTPFVPFGVMRDNCPGCEAIARGIAARDIEVA